MIPYSHIGQSKSITPVFNIAMGGGTASYCQSNDIFPIHMDTLKNNNINIKVNTGSVDLNTPQKSFFQ